MQKTCTLLMMRGWATECFSRDQRPAHPSREKTSMCAFLPGGGGGSLLPQGNMLEACGLGERNLPHHWSWTLLSVLVRMFPFSRKPAQYSDQYDLWLLSYLLIREETKPVTLRIQQKGASESSFEDAGDRWWVNQRGGIAQSQA